MFFGLEVKSNQNQSKSITLANTLKLSHAVLDPSKNNKKEPVCLMVEYEKKQFILCVLDPNVSWQSPLDLVFESGSQVKFFIRGAGTVHLTGYEDYDELDDVSMSMSSDDEVVSESDDDNITVVPVKKKQLAKNGSAKKSPKAEKTNGLKTVPKKVELTNGDDEEEDDDDSDDDDFDFGDLDEDDDDDEDEDDDDDDEDEDDDEDMNDEEDDLELDDSSEDME